MSGSEVGPRPGWYSDPANGEIRWWDGDRWAEPGGDLSGDAAGSTSGPHRRRFRGLRALQVLIGCTLLAIPINLATALWAERAAQNAACDPPVTWGEWAFGTFVPWAFVLVAFGCLIVAIVAWVRGPKSDTGETRRRFMTAIAALIALILVFITGFVAAFGVGTIGWCF